MKVTQSQLLSFIGGSVIVGFAVEVASTTWRGNEWIWGSLGFLAALAIFLVPSDGLLRRHRYGQARWVRLIALVLLICYPFILWRLSRGHGLLAVLTPALFLWAASALLEDILSNSGSTVGKLRFVVRRRVDVAAWVRQGEALLDLRTAGAFRGAGEMLRIADASLRPSWETGKSEPRPAWQ